MFLDSLHSLSICSARRKEGAYPPRARVFSPPHPASRCASTRGLTINGDAVPVQSAQRLILSEAEPKNKQLYHRRIFAYKRKAKRYKANK